MSKIPSVQSLERAFSLLEAFAPANNELGISELSRKIDLPRPTVSRLVATLEKQGYLRQNKETKKYSLGLKLLHLGAVVQAGLYLKDIAGPVLLRLRDQLRETVYIDVVDGDDRVCIDSLPGLNAVRTIVEVGQRSPLYAGADSRMLLSSLSDEEFEAYLKRTRLASYTPNTITDPDQLRRVVSEIRRLGYSYSVSEFHPGSACVSAPIRDGSGKIVAAVSVSFPELKTQPEHVEMYKEAVMEAAREISSLLGYNPRNGQQS
ncbi:MAG: IclR family transcriptional regulator [Bacillota bacterium]